MYEYQEKKVSSRLSITVSKNMFIEHKFFSSIKKMLLLLVLKTDNTYSYIQIYSLLRLDLATINSKLVTKFLLYKKHCKCGLSRIYFLASELHESTDNITYFGNFEIIIKWNEDISESGAVCCD